jgi:hypothetical protein
LDAFSVMVEVMVVEFLTIATVTTPVKVCVSVPSDTLMVYVNENPVDELAGNGNL